MVPARHGENTANEREKERRKEGEDDRERKRDRDKEWKRVNLFLP